MKSKKPVLHLSQSNLQDFKDCPRRFQLKEIENIAWPTAYLEPLSRLEQATDLGNNFHQLCLQYFTGIDLDSLSQNISDPGLKIMWENFRTFAKDLQEQDRFAEIILSTPFLSHQLIAKYDLVLKTSEGKFVIYDWKTSTKKPSRTLLSQRFQTFLYPFIFAKAGNNIFHTDQPFPGDISLNYWYPMASDPEEIFPYSEIQYSENFNQLTKIISEIDDLVGSGDPFPLTDDQNHCLKCVFRSLCDRGILAGDLDIFSEIDQEDLSNVKFDLDNISEIEF